jgi:hypothetical protein
MLNVNLKGEGTIDNAVIYLEDPKEKMPYFLDPKSNEEWEKDGLNIPLEGDLDYSLYVLAYSGTRFKCVITNSDDGKTITIEGTTGKKIKNQAHETGSKKFK